jgi:membrane protease YdiL (CAAX protease family)
LKAGAGLTLAVWGSTQLVHVSINLAVGMPIQLHADWAQLGVLAVLGLLIGQLLGNALYEEIVFRRVFVSQWYDRSHALRSPAVRLLVVLVGVQFFFALMHIPHRLAVGVALGDLPEHLVRLTVDGLWYAWIYLQTRNLFFAVGVHALSNHPTLVPAQAMYPPRLLMWIVTLGLLMHLLLLGLRRWARPSR